LQRTAKIHFNDGAAMIYNQFAKTAVSMSLLDRAIFASICAMSMFALFSPILALGTQH
jgi:hypothetical protein